MNSAINTFTESSGFLSMKPTHYIETRWQKEVIYPDRTDVFRHKQPVQYCNGKTYYQYPEQSFERLNWGTIYWDSWKVNQSLDALNYKSPYWKDVNAMIQAFSVIYDFCKNGKSGQGSSITALLPFEIELMNDGFKMASFCELNAINPSYTVVGGKREGDVIHNHLGVCYRRFYEKDGKFVYLGFGFKTPNREVQFYFRLSDNMNNFYQVENDLSKYEDAINGKLPIIE